MPDVISFPQRRTSVSSSFHPATATNLPGASAARRASGLLSSFLRWLSDVSGWSEGIFNVSEGAYMCPHCLSVYDDEAQHICETTAYCLDCDRRVVIETTSARGSVCSVCHRTSYVLARRGV